MALPDGAAERSPYQEKEKHVRRPRIEAVVFDCDGVLADSEPLHDAATREELEHRGFALANSFFDEHIGMRVADQMAVLAARHGFDPDDLYAGRERRFWKLARTRFAESRKCRHCPARARSGFEDRGGDLRNPEADRLRR